MERYDILTLNAKSLMWFSTKKGNHPEYRIDLSSKEDSRNFSVISVTDEMDDSPFFYQVLQCSKKKNPFDSKRLLYEDVIFVDFKDCLLFLNKRNVLLELKKYALSSKPLKKKVKGKKGSPKRLHSENIRGFSVGKHLSTLLSSKYGIYITFENGYTKHFVPSDRSSSMAKAGKLAFINQEYLDEMKKRLCLDMDFKKISLKTGGIQLSKYYAYRGLYLTSSERINFDNPKKIINKDTFIVLDDFKDYPIDGDNKTYFTAKKEKNSSRHEFYTTPEYKEQLNLYDGEGLICPDLTTKINDCLYEIRERDRDVSDGPLKDYKWLTGIQLRGPFLKGMVFTADFEHFFRKYGKTKNNKLLIKDAFGVERNLLEAKIIVNKSMFKCTDWLKAYCDGKYQDPMDFYFKAFYKYNHALYVANAVNDVDEDWGQDDEPDEADLKSVGTETLNYQFLSTLNITADELNSLIKTHFEIAESTLREKYSFNTETSRSLPVYLSALKLNPLFKDDPKVQGTFAAELKNYRILCGRGKLKTYGEHRYLSSDLLAYMIDILKRSDAKKEINDLHTLDKYSFYAPVSNNIKPYSGEIAFERNPHLSRQEEVVLRAFVPDCDSPYKQFGLDKLTNMVMFPRASLNFMVLSSADTDGDMVFMYSDEIIVNAIKRSGYDEKLDRKLPIIIIPDEGKTLTMATAEGNPDIPLLIDTLSNQVGKISNMAVTFARNEYADDDAADSNNTAKCTILTGLEIDKIKHGFSVAQDISKLGNECRILRDYHRKDYFIERKEKISGPDAVNCNVKRVKRGQGFILSNYENDYLSVGIKPLNEVSFPLDRLLAYFGDLESNAKKEDGKAQKKILTATAKELAPFKYRYFFETNPSWADLLDKNQLKKVEQLIRSYSKILTCFRNITYSLEISEATNFHGKALFYLQKRYDGGDLSFKPRYSNKTVEALLIEAETIFETYIKTYDSAISIMDLMVNQYKWPFIINKEKRKGVLKELISDKIPEDILEFLTDFREEGYFLAYYILKFVYYRLRMQRPVTEMISRRTLEQYGKNPYWNSMLSQLIYAIQHKYTYSKFLKTMNHFCRLEIDSIFTNSDDAAKDAIPYIYYISKRKQIGNSFMWNIIPSNTLLDSIYQPQKDINHA